MPANPMALPRPPSRATYLLKGAADLRCKFGEEEAMDGGRRGGREDRHSYSSSPPAKEQRTPMPMPHPYGEQFIGAVPKLPFISL